MKRRSCWLPLLGVLLLCGCSTPSRRVEANRELFEAFTPEQQAAIQAGRLEPGFTTDMVQLAWGDPSEIVNRTSATPMQEIWSYSNLAGRDLGPHATYHPSAGRREETPRAHRQPGRSPQGDWARIVFEDGILTEVQRVVGP